MGKPEVILALFSGVSALVAVAFLFMYVKSQETGENSENENDRMMKQVSDKIRAGAMTFLKREYQTVSILLVILAGLMFFFLDKSATKDVNEGMLTAIGFIVGAFCSGLAGYIGMNIATHANCRTTYAAKKGMPEALNIAFSGGAVMGLSVAGLAIIGLALVYAIFGVEAIDGYAMGASLIALFARVGGGIYTKGADMGADLVGKVEENIPEDDPRNPASIADNVGDNVGDVAGLGADLLESFVGSIISGMVLITGMMHSKELTEAIGHKLLILPMLIAAVGVLASIIGVIGVKLLASDKPHKSLMMGTYISTILTGIGSYIIITKFGTAYTMNGIQYNILGPFWATVLGLIAGMLVGFVSEYYTSDEYSPVQELAHSCDSGHAINITNGLAIGMKSTLGPVIFIGLAILLSFKVAGLFGIGMAALGMLATTGMTVAIDAYGPVADNAGGIAQMSNQPPEVRKITDKLDSVGNTTAAIGKGFAIGSAAFAALGLFAAYVEVSGIPTAEFNVINPIVMVGIFIGGMLPYFFSALLIEGVSISAYAMVDEVRRQFREIPGLREGKKGVLPDSVTCVDIATKGALKAMIIPGLIAIFVPILVGKFFGKILLGGLLVGSLVTGLQLAIQVGNSGGAWDNAKKYIEEGKFTKPVKDFPEKEKKAALTSGAKLSEDGTLIIYGKGSEAHKASVTGDTVGDPLKDTVGPSIDILIKLMAIVSLVFCELFPRLPFFMK